MVSARKASPGAGFRGRASKPAPTARPPRLAHVLTNSAATALRVSSRVHAATDLADAAREKQYADGRAKRTMLRALTSGARVDAARAFVVRSGKRLGEDMTTKRLRTTWSRIHSHDTADLLYARAQQRNRTRAYDDEVSKQSETIRMAENLAEGYSALHGAAEDVKALLREFETGNHANTNKAVLDRLAIAKVEIERDERGASIKHAEMSHECARKLDHLSSQEREVSKLIADAAKPEEWL